VANKDKGRGRNEERHEVSGYVRAVVACVMDMKGLDEVRDVVLTGITLASPIPPYASAFHMQ
jgi:hypothetical protein